MRVNYKCIYIRTLFITIIMCIFLFICLDISILSSCESVQKTIISSNIIHKNHSNYMELSKINIIKLEDTFLKTMQIADIYEEVSINGIESGISSNEQERLIQYNAIDDNWKIEIPKIGVNAPIKSGTTQAVLSTAVGHFPGTTSWNGNIPLAGHNRGYLCNFFKNLKYLEMGDKIIYHSKEGRREYKVIFNKIIKQTDWTYIQNTKDNRITLITCVENMSEYRRCIQAIETI